MVIFHNFSVNLCLFISNVSLDRLSWNEIFKSGEPLLNKLLNKSNSVFHMSYNTLAKQKKNSYAAKSNLGPRTKT